MKDNSGRYGNDVETEACASQTYFVSQYMQIVITFAWHTGCNGQLGFPQNSYTEILTPNIVTLVGGPLEVIRSGG